MSADHIQLILPAVGSLAGGGTVDPENLVNFRMQASVHTGGVAAMLYNAPVPFINVDVPGAEPAFHPDLAAVMKDGVKGVGKATGRAIKGLLTGKK